MSAGVGECDPTHEENAVSDDKRAANRRTGLLLAAVALGFFVLTLFRLKGGLP